eukprot:gb/GFBE01065234.1/.p1 GENE.gb/GFBE01065234.1/~~gb/GFBE01065234.1/.p1  ORF type:complete len:420 (+),score=102.30 gb/GFBE01065234.1/:1-1260(+)
MTALRHLSLALLCWAVAQAAKYDLYHAASIDLPDVTPDKVVVETGRLGSSPQLPQPAPSQQVQLLQKQGVTRSEKKRQQVTLVLVVSQSSSDTLPRLLASLARWRENSVRELLLVVPRAEKRSFETLFSKRMHGSVWDAWMKHSDAKLFKEYIHVWFQARFPVRTVAEEDVLPEERELEALVPQDEKAEPGGQGVRKRMDMLLRIGIAKHVTTEFYVTLKKNVVATRSFGYSDFVTAAGKARVQGEKHFGQHPERYQAAAAVLKATNCVPLAEDPVLGVTPAVVPTKVARGLMSTLPGLWAGELGQQTWDVVLMKLLNTTTHEKHEWAERTNLWNEYSLLYVSSCAQGIRDEIFQKPAAIDTVGLYSIAHDDAAIAGSFSGDSHSRPVFVVASDDMAPELASRDLLQFIAGRRGSLRGA